MLLAQAVWRLDGDDMKVWEVAAFTGPFANGLMVPVLMGVHGWFAYGAAKVMPDEDQWTRMKEDRVRLH
eukprot:10948038-Ditylum_brightwellii.AAC.1